MASYQGPASSKRLDTSSAAELETRDLSETDHRDQRGKDVGQWDNGSLAEAKRGALPLRTARTSSSAQMPTRQMPRRRRRQA